jgi:hypothetical protein
VLEKARYSCKHQLDIIERQYGCRSPESKVCSQSQVEIGRACKGICVQDVAMPASSDLS